MDISLSSLADFITNEEIIEQTVTNNIPWQEVRSWLKTNGYKPTYEMKFTIDEATSWFKGQPFYEAENVCTGWVKNTSKGFNSGLQVYKNSTALTGGVTEVPEVIDTTMVELTETGATVAQRGVGVATAVSAAQIISAVATGIGLGLKTFKEHPTYWTAISNQLVHTGNYTVGGFTPDGQYTLDPLTSKQWAMFSSELKEGAQEPYTKDDYITKMYLPEEMVNNQLKWSVDNKAWDGVYWHADKENKSMLIHPDSYNNGIVSGGAYYEYGSESPTRKMFGLRFTTGSGYLVWVKGAIIAVSKEPFTADAFSNYAHLENQESTTTTYNGITYHYVGLYGVRQSSTFPITELTTDDSLYSEWDIAHILFTGIVTQIGEDRGITPLGGYVPQYGNVAQDFPDWHDKRKTIHGVSDKDGTQYSVDFLPVSIPNFDPLKQDSPTDGTDLQKKAQEGNLPDDDDIVKQLIEQIEDLKKKLKTDPRVDPFVNPDVPDVPPVPPATPTPPEVPVIPDFPTGNALWSVYNPTKTEVNALGEYLWTNNIIEIISQFFQNPMDAIISLHLIYATPATGTPQNIKLGYLDTGVSSKIVSNYVIELDCGELTLREFYGNIYDYNPYTQVSIYLPFIGIRELDTDIVMASKISLVYYIDVLTGTCVAMLTTEKNGNVATMYQFDGNCSVQIPLSASDKTRLLSGVLTAGVGLATGNPLLIGGAVLGGSKVSVSKSGNISGNAGALALKTPYLIISRSIPYRQNYKYVDGLPCSVTANLYNCKGYVKCSNVSINSTSATDEEITEIKDLLTNGVYIN